MKRSKDGQRSARLKRWLLATFLLALFTGFGFGFTLLVPSWHTNVFAAVWQGASCYLVLNYVGIILALRILHTKDAEFFWFTPLTMTRYLRRNARRIFFVLALVYLVYPVWLLTALPEEYRFNYPFVANFLLLYALSILVPLQERISGRGYATMFFFPLRRVFDAGLSLAILYIGFMVANRVLSAAPAKTVHAFNAWIEPLEGIALTHALGLLISPVSEIVLVVHTTFATPVLYCALAWHTTIAFCCIRDFVAFAQKDNAQRESEALEKWLEERPELEARRAMVDDYVAQSLALSENQRHTPGADYAQLMEVPGTPDQFYDTNTIAYDETLSPEAQASRHFDYFKKLPRILRSRRASNALDRIPLSVLAWLRSEGLYLVLIVGAFIVYCVGLARPDAQLVGGWSVLIALWCMTYNRPFRLRWLVTCGLAMPLRWPKLIWGDFRHHLRRCLFADIAAALILVLLLHQPILFAPLWWCFFRLAALSAYTITMMESFHKAGKPWPLRLTTVAAFVLRFAQFGISFIFIVPALESPAFTASTLDELLCVCAVFGVELAYLLFALALVFVSVRRRGGAHLGAMHWPTPFFSNEIKQAGSSVDL